MAGFDVFLKLDGIDGESTTKGHEKEIEVVSYDQSIDSSPWYVHPAPISQARVSRSGAPHWIFTSSRSKTSS